MKKILVSIFASVFCLLLNAQTVDFEVVGFLRTLEDSTTADTFFVAHDAGYSPIVLIRNNGEDTLDVSDTLVLDVYCAGMLSTTRKISSEMLGDFRNGETLAFEITGMSGDYITFEDFETVYPGGMTIPQQFNLCVSTSVIGDAVDNNSNNDNQCYYVLRLKANEIENFENSVLSIFPNPSNEYITIKTSQNANIKVFNTEGKLVKELANINGEKKIDVTLMLEGIYYLQIESEGVLTSKKLIITK